MKFTLLISVVMILTAMPSCQTEPDSQWNGEGGFTICQYLDLNQTEYSKFYSLLAEGKLNTTLCGYNPYGDGYTLFLPTNDAIDRFISESPVYDNFEELLQDTSFTKSIVRYHVLKRKVHTDEFPFGAITDSTLTGDRLTAYFSSDGDNQLIKINNSAPVIKSNIDMTNGYIHTVSEVLQKAEIRGYDWLQQQNDYSILAQAMELTEVTKGMWWSKYTILAEHDSIFHRNGIYTVEDLIGRIATPGMSYSNKNNAFYMFTGYHIVGGEYYLNEWKWGSKKYVTLNSKQLTINVGMDIRINPGIDTYGISISGSGDTTVIGHISPVWDYSNIMTLTGPVHSISELLFYEPFPKQ